MTTASILERSREMTENVAEAIVGEEQLGSELWSGFGKLLFRVFGRRCI